MRWLVLVCGCAASSPAPLANESRSPPPRPPEAELRALLGRLEPNELLYLHPVGWLSSACYGHIGSTKPTGEAPAPKSVTAFTGAPTVIAKLERAPLANHDYPTELDRYRAAMTILALRAGVDDLDDDVDASTVVLRPTWADALGARIERELLSNRTSVIEHVGTISVIEERDGAHVTFRAAVDAPDACGH